MNDLRQLWQGQTAATPFRMSPEELAARVDALTRRVGALHRLGLILFAMTVVGCLWWTTLVKSPMPKIGALLTIAGVGVTLWQTRKNFLANETAMRDAAEGGVPAVEFHRAQLRRQRDFHRGAAFWSRLLVLLPGPFLYIVGLTLEYPHVLPIVVLEVLAFVALGVVAIVNNRRAAARYQRELEALEG